MNRSPQNKRRRNPRRTFFAVLLYGIATILCIAILFGLVLLVKKIGVSVSLDDEKAPIDTVVPADGEKIPETSQPTEPDPIPEPTYRHATFAAAGDILVHTNVYKYAAQLAQGTDKEYDFKPIFANIKEIISSADAAYVNQETICGGKDLGGYSGYPMFNTPDEIAEAVVDTGFDIVNIANNHMLDKGERGLSRAIDFWNEQPVTLIGGFKDKEDYENIRIYEVNGIKIAFLAYTYWTNGLTLPSSSPLVVPYDDHDEVDRQTKAAREIADIVMVSMHWGDEDNFTPNEDQTELAAIMAKNNVDVVLGMHPHVLQKIERIPRSDGKEMLCAYSLGNLISTMMYSRNMLGGILCFEINEDENGFSIDNAELVPTMVHYSAGFSSPTIYLFKDYTQEMQSTHGSRRYDNPPKDIDYLNGILTKYIPKEYIKEPSLQALYDSAAA